MARHRIHANPFTVRGEIAVPDWLAVYGREAPFALDVGCAKGVFAAQLARAHPEWNVLGVEIREHFVDRVRATAAERGLKNLYAVVANINLHLVELLPDGSVAFVAVNFPDPWYKKRHHKRRVVQTVWLDQLSHKLRPGAELHAATDYEPIALDMLETLSAHPAFETDQAPGTFAEASTTGIASEREQVHMDQGHPVYRLKFRYVA